MKKTWLALCFALLLIVSALPTSQAAQDELAWLPTGDERWIFQNEQTEILGGGLVFDVDREQAVIPEIVVIPLYSSNPTVKPLSAELIAEYHVRGIRVVCGIVAGYWDSDAPDSQFFTPSMIGRSVWGDGGHRWVDVRNSGVWDLMAARIERADAIGCDAVDVSYLELWYQNTGFFITYGDQLAFNRYLADTAHAFGLAIALHNTSQQVNDLVGWFDFVIVEGCLEAGECTLYAPFQALGKPVFHVEYVGMTYEMHVCNAARDLRFNSLIKERGSAFDRSARAC